MRSCRYTFTTWCRHCQTTKRKSTAAAPANFDEKSTVRASDGKRDTATPPRRNSGAILAAKSFATPSFAGTGICRLSSGARYRPLIGVITAPTVRAMLSRA